MLVKAGLDLPADAKFSLYRVLELLGMLAKTMSSLDQWSRVVWNRCAEDNVQSVPLSAGISTFLAASESTKAQATLALEEQIASAVRRIQTLISALGNLPRQYAEKFAPEVIEQQFGSPGKADHYIRCWQGYVFLCGGQEAKRLTQEISDFWPIVLDRMQKSNISADSELSNIEIRGHV
jgi:hypothetical protein